MAVTDSTARFTIQLDDKASGPSMTAAKALEELRSTLVKDKKALADMNRGLKDMQQGSSVNLRAAQELRQKIELKKQAISDASGKVVELGGSLNLSRKRMDENKVSSMGMSDVVGKLGIGTVSAAAAFVAFAAAVGLATISLTKFAFAQASARRDEEIQLEGLSKIRDWYGRAATGAQEMQGYMDQVSSSTSLGRGEISKYNEQLYRMGLRGENLKQALMGVSKVASVQDSGQANLFMSMAANAAFAGGSVKALADDVEARLGGTVKKKMLSMDVQMLKFKENIGALFHGLNIGKFLEAINQIVGMFSVAEATGQAWKIIMETLFQPLFDGLGEGTPLVKRFIQGITIAVLSLMIVVLKAKNWMKETFGTPEWVKNIDMGSVAIWAGYAAVAAFAFGLSLLVAPMVAIGVASLAMGAVLAVGLAIALAPVALLGAALYGLWEAGKVAWEALKSFGNWIMDFDWKGLGASIIDGIVNGLKDGAGALVSAMKGLGTGAIDSFKETLGIHSPSKVFAEAGLNITQGVQQGVEQGAPGANESVTRMMTVPSSGGGAASAAGGSHVFNITVNAEGGDGNSIAQAVAEAVTRALEGIAVSMGAPMEGANV